jgi:hypothetical protein
MDSRRQRGWPDPILASLNRAAAVSLAEMDVGKHCILAG